MAGVIRWGILGAGRIAEKFAQAFRVVQGAQIVAAASRTHAAAQAFATRYAIPRAHSSYEALAVDPDVDIVYVATPHSLHHPNTLLCLDAGKHVLCEKPLTINAEEARSLIDTARQRGLFLMEGMWTRFFPVMARLRALAADGALGEITMLHADFGYDEPFDPRSRAFDPVLGGGALLDVGVYPVALAFMLLGRPDRVAALAHLGAAGVDERNGVLFGYAGGALAVLSSAVRSHGPRRVQVTGTRASALIEEPWWRPGQMTVHAPGAAAQVINEPVQATGFEYEIAAVSADLRAGRTENAIMPLDESLAIMETLDTIRAGWGLRYPGES